MLEAARLCLENAPITALVIIEEEQRSGLVEAKAFPVKVRKVFEQAACELPAAWLPVHVELRQVRAEHNELRLRGRLSQNPGAQTLERA